LLHVLQRVTFRHFVYRSHNYISGFLDFYGPETNGRECAYYAVRNESFNIPGYVSFFMGRTACAEPQCLYKGALYFLLSCFIFKEGVRWPRESIVGLSERRLGCSPRSIHVMCPLGVLVLGRAFFHVIRFSFVYVITSVLRTRLHLHVPLTRKTTWRILGTFRKECLFGNREHRIEKNLKPAFKGLSHLIVYLQIKIPIQWTLFQVSREHESLRHVHNQLADYTASLPRKEQSSDKIFSMVNKFQWTHATILATVWTGNGNTSPSGLMSVALYSI